MRGQAGSERTDLLSLGTLGALTRGELDPLVLLKGAEAVSLNGGVVHEDVSSAIVWCDKTVALVGIEPLYGALRHVPSPTRRSPGPTCEDPGLQRPCVCTKPAPGARETRSQIRQAQVARNSERNRAHQTPSRVRMLAGPLSSPFCLARPIRHIRCGNGLVRSGPRRSGLG